MTRQEISRGTAVGWLAAIVAVGAALRLVGLGTDPLWGDEALTVMLAQYPVFDLMFRPVDPTPGLYYVLHGLLVPADAGATAQRLVSAVAGIATIVAAYWLGRSSFDRRAGLWLAALVAVWSLLVIYGREARAYSLLFLLITLAAACFVNAFPPRAKDEKAIVRTPYVLACGLFSLLAVYTHMTGWLWAGPALLAVLLMWERRAGASVWRVVVTIGAALLLVAPELARLAGYAFSPLNVFSWLRQATPTEFLSVSLSVILPDRLQPNILGSLPRVAAGIIMTTLLLVPMAAFSFALISRRRAVPSAIARRASVAIVMAILMGFPLFAWLIGFAATPIFMPRTILPAGLAMFLAYVWIDRAAPRRFVAPLTLASFAVATALTLPAYQKTDWVGIVKEVERARRPGEAVLLCPSWHVPAMLIAMRPTGGPPRQLLMASRSEFVAIQVGGSKRDSLDQYNDARWAPALPAYADRPPRSTLRPMTFQSVLIARFQCRPPEWTPVRQWLGPGRLDKIALGDGPVKPNFSLVRFVAEQPQRRVVRGAD